MQATVAINMLSTSVNHKITRVCFDDFVFHTIATSAMFSERGTRGNSPSLAGEPAITARAREMMKDGTVRSLTEGIEQAIAENPELYEQYNRAHMQRASRAG